MDFWHDSAVQKRWLLRLTLFIGLLLVPVFVLAVFARPSADDYIYAARTHAVMQQYGFDLPRLLKAAWDTNVYYFENWQGLYVSGFLLAWQPAIFGNAWYGVTLLCVLVPLFFCLYGACRCVVRRLDQAQKLLPWALALLVCFAFIEGMPAPVEGLYWFNGAMNYLPYFSLAVLNAGLTFGLCFAPQLTHKQRTLYCAAGVVIGFIIGGGHQVAGLLNVLVLLLAVVLCARQRRFYHLPAFLAAVAGLLINVTAPGTRVRAAGFAGAGFVEAVLKSFVLAALEWVRWLDVPLLCLLVLLALPLRYLAQSSSLSDRVFRHPLAGRHLYFNVGHDFPAILHDGRHRCRAAAECGLDDLHPRLGRYRVSALWLAGAYPRRLSDACHPPAWQSREAPAAGLRCDAGLYGLHRQPYGKRGAG